MSTWRFPLPLLGLVHTSIGIRQVRDLGAGEEFGLSVRAAELTPHRRGTEAHLVTQVRAAGEVVWESSSTYLARHGTPAEGSQAAGGSGAADGEVPAHGERLADVSRPADGERPADTPRPAAAPPDDTARAFPPRAAWPLAADLGRRYGAVSKDRNPIHLHPLTARLFGFPRPIAHGMWSVARCLAEQEQRGQGAVQVCARFRAPVLLPATVTYAAEGTAFALRGGANAARVHLTGEVLPLTR